MSGLAAVFHRDGQPADRAHVGVMLAAVPHRGPDGCDVGVFGAVGLGHARMTLTSEDAAEHQPVVSPRTGCIIIADARLDNRDDLLTRLSFELPRASSDAGLILHAYDAWGTKAVADLLGDFAFVLWDPRDQRMICARDTSGQRTLFYRLDSRTFAAASEIHQLLQQPGTESEPNEERILDFLAVLPMGRNEKDSAATFYAGVNAVPAGHIMEVGASNVRTWKYWDLDDRELRYRSDTEYEEHFRSLLFEVVRAQLRCEGPVGALLSGGLDSSTIVCSAQELIHAGTPNPGGFETFSSVYPDPRLDERAFIDSVKNKHGLATHYVPAKHGCSTRLDLEPARFLEAPSVWAGAERDTLLGSAVQHGVRVLLTGEVADACIGGSPVVFDSLLRRGRLRALATYLTTYRQVSHESLATVLGLYCVTPFLPKPVRARIMPWHTSTVFKRDQQHMFPGWMPGGLRTELGRRLLRTYLTEQREPRFSNPTREMEYRLLYPPEVSRNFGAWPIEFRRPFADRRLHQFLLAIPPEQKFRPLTSGDELYGGSKWLVRRAMKGIVPEPIRTRRNKTIFDASFGHELDREWSTYAAAFGPAARTRIAARGYVDQARFWSRLQSIRAGEEAPDLVCVIRLVELETWLRSLESHTASRMPAPVSWKGTEPVGQTLR